MAIDPTIAGKRFGHLTTAYADHTGHRIACRCICSRLTFVAAADLVSGSDRQLRLPSRRRPLITSRSRICPHC